MTSTKNSSWLSAVGVLLGLPLALAATRGHAGDWPQILGPARNGVAVGETLPAKFPNGGPRTLWTYRLGAGYGGPVVAGKSVLVFHRVNDTERVEALNADTGASQWKADFSATYQGGIDPDIGPRATPVVQDGRVFVFGAAGDLHCVDFATGRKIWSRAASTDFGSQEGYFGVGSSPIVVDGKVLVNVGGSQGAGIVAFAADSGKTVWQATDEAASYSSPTVATIGGQTHVIFVTRLNCLSLDPANGEVRFRFPFGQRGPTVNAATPLVFDQNRLFVSAAYNVGAVLAEITPQGAKSLWSNDESMSSQYSTCVHYQGHLYGVDGREDYSNGKLRCVEAATGNVKWSDDGFGIAHVLLAGDRLLALKTTGEIVITPATPESFQPLATATVSNSGVTRAIPAFSNGRLFFRTSENNAGVLKCVEITGTKKN
jgi:outer membrane protein assembly factor BamB